MNAAMLAPLADFPVDPVIAALPKAGLHVHYEAHRIRQFVDAGVPVTLNTDNPVRLCTTIGREYAIAAALGFNLADLLAFTRTAIQASFTSAAHKAKLLRKVRAWPAQSPLP